MRLAVLSHPESWYYQDLARAAGSHQLHCFPFSELSSSLDSQRVTVSSLGMDLGEFDAVLVRSMPLGSLEQVVFRMDCLAALETAGVTVINPPKAMEVAIDKYLALVRLQAAGLPVPPTEVCHTVEQAMVAFERFQGDVVLKPIFGSEGRGITRLHDPDLAWRAFTMLSRMGAVLYLQPFLPHDGSDLRCLLLGSNLWAMRRANPLDWRTNISRGGTAAPTEATDEQRDLVYKVAQAIGAPFLGVDLLTSDGKTYVLEANAVPGWRALARVHQVDFAAGVWRFLERRCQGG